MLLCITLNIMRFYWHSNAKFNNKRNNIFSIVTSLYFPIYKVDRPPNNKHIAENKLSYKFYSIVRMYEIYKPPQHHPNPFLYYVNHVPIANTEQSPLSDRFIISFRSVVEIYSRAIRKDDNAVDTCAPLVLI